MDNPSFDQQVKGNEIICTEPFSRTISMAWSTAFIEINSSNAQCVVRENIEHDTNQTIRGNSSFFRLFFWIHSFYASSSKCQHIAFVPIFTKYCLALETYGDLEFKFVLKKFDFQLFLMWLSGWSIFYSASKLRKMELLHFVFGIAIGTFASILIPIIIIIRFLPKKSFMLIFFRFNPMDISELFADI